MSTMPRILAPDAPAALPADERPASTDIRPAPPDPRPVSAVTSRFPPGSRSIWSGVPDAQWNDWHWQQRERITRVDQLEKVIRLTDDERRAAVETEKDFHMGITPYYAALMDPDDPTCPVRLQSVPTMDETVVSSADLEDPLGEDR
ncbi:MAG TPA: hypothetical protein VFM53_16550, partial [Anaeromyxobacteraceae bacterium]|nr:hypothetical protein [Anaeromyxobacteraceae bacterium]